MNRKLQGIALLLFGILLNFSAETIDDIFFSDLSHVDYLITLIAVLIGIVGVVMVFVDAEKFTLRKKK